MSNNPPIIKRGEIWLINLDPTIGAEIKKTRPAVVISSDAVGKLPLKVIVPVTEWSDAFATSHWHVRIAPSAENGLKKLSAVDAFQVRSVSTARFHARWGKLNAVELEEVVQAVAIVIEL
jgi:mRNA interferase MazF